MNPLDIYVEICGNLWKSVERCGNMWKYVEAEGHHEEDECHRSNSRGECCHEGTGCAGETHHKKDITMHCCLM